MSPSTSLAWFALLLSSTIVCQTHADDSIIFPAKGAKGRYNCNGPTLDVIELVQTMYVQYQEFIAEVPTMKGFMSCFWINVKDAYRSGTALNYGLDEINNTDNLTIMYRPNENGWSLNINGYRVYTARAPLLTALKWTHSCHSWDGNTGDWSVWQDAALVASGNNKYSIGSVVYGGGVMVTGQHQNTLHNGMDAGEGVIGSLTLVQVFSTPLPHDTRAAWYKVRQLAGNCVSSDFGDVVGWHSTPRRGYGGVLKRNARSNTCGYF